MQREQRALLGLQRFERIAALERRIVRAGAQRAEGVSPLLQRSRWLLALAFIKSGMFHAQNERAIKMLT